MTYWHSLRLGAAEVRHVPSSTLIVQRDMIMIARTTFALALVPRNIAFSGCLTALRSNRASLLPLRTPRMVPANHCERETPSRPWLIVSDAMRDTGETQRKAMYCTGGDLDLKDRRQACEIRTANI